MLKKFFLNFLSSFVGAWVALGLFCITIVIVIVGGVAKMGLSSKGDVESIERHSVMTLDLSGVIEEREQPAEFDYMTVLNGGELKSPMTLSALTQAIRNAKENDDIEMIYIKCGGVSGGTATMHALRKELLDFKKSGKKIYSYGDVMAFGDYYIASVADSVFLNPDGMLALQGISGMVPYMKDLFDKIGIQFQVAKVGKFKSAVEPYISNEMSEPARAQLDTLYGGMWHVLIGDIAKSRKLTYDKINTCVNDYLILRDGDYSVKHKLVDAAVYERTMDERIARAIGVEKKKLNYVSHATVAASDIWGADFNSKNRIAVLYAVGEIMEGTKRGINCEVLVPVITELADDEKVKGMVLRVNSPGGSVFGSEQIADALAYFQSKGKPLAVSMGDYAASGGYWISCHADRIFADPLTVTGSIGIFGLFPNASGLAEKLGIHPQFVSTNPDVNFPTLLKPIDETQMAQMQSFIEKGYDRFINRVATGRKLKPEYVRTIAEGRVWSGAKAKELGLVDELGMLSASIDWVQTKVNGKDGKKCDVAAYPVLETSFWDMVQISTQSNVRISLIKEAMKMAPDEINALEVGNTLRRKPVQARMMPLVTKF